MHLNTIKWRSRPVHGFLYKDLNISWKVCQNVPTFPKNVGTQNNSRRYFVGKKELLRACWYLGLSWIQGDSKCSSNWMFWSLPAQKPLVSQVHFRETDTITTSNILSNYCLCNIVQYKSYTISSSLRTTIINSIINSQLINYLSINSQPSLTI